jgi:hypothetical protein
LAIDERMAGTNIVAGELGRELFCCRPRSLRSYFQLSYQGALPQLKWLKFLTPAIVVVSPMVESLVLAGLPTMLSIFVLQVVLGLKPPHEPVWVRPFCFAVPAISIPVTFWWCWIAPRKDVVVVGERGFRWRVSWSNWNWFRSRGSVAVNDLEAFSFRSDCFSSEPLECGNTLAEKLKRIQLESDLSHYDMAFHLKNDRSVVVGKFFARFEPDDLQRFLDHLATIAEPIKIAV